MAFKSYQSTDITSETVVFTGPTGVETTIIGMSIANTANAPANVDVKLNSAYLAKNAPIPIGGTLVVVGGDQKVVVEQNSTIKVASTTPVDVVISTLEV